MHLWRWSKIAGKSRAVGDDACQAFATYSDADCRPCAAGKSSRVRTLIVYRETLMSIRQHRVPRFHHHVPWTILGLVSPKHDPTVLLGRFFETFNRHAASRTRVEGVQHRPFPIRRVIRREIKHVTLRRIAERYNSVNNLASRDRLCLCDRMRGRVCEQNDHDDHDVISHTLWCWLDTSRVHRTVVILQCGVRTTLRYQCSWSELLGETNGRRIWQP